MVRANPDRFRVVGLTAGGGQPGAVRATGGRVPRPSPLRAWARRHRSRRRTALRRRAQRHHRCGRPPADAGGARGRQHARPGQQGVAHHRRSAGEAGARSRARSSRSTASTARSPSACAAGAARRYDASCSPRAAARSAGAPATELAGVTPEQALAHPNFAMGRVITTNSATLVNKGLEVIEAHLLFDVPFDRIDVVVHPQQLHPLDGRVHRRRGGRPDRPPDDAGADRARDGLARPGAGRRDAGRLDEGRRLALRAARRRGVPGGRARPRGRQRGGTAPAVYNAANEVCVEAFHEGRLPFPGIVDMIAARCWRATTYPRRAAHHRRRPRRRRLGARRPLASRPYGSRVTREFAGPIPAR